MAESPDCRALHAFLAENDIPFVEKDVGHPGVKQQLFLKYGVLVVPVIVIEKRAFFGYDSNRAAIRKALGLEVA